MPLFSSATLPLSVGSGSTPVVHSAVFVPPLKPGDPLSPTTPVPGFALIPPKLVQRIRRGDYIEMREMLPDAWQAPRDDHSCCRATRPRRGGLVTDILLWTEGYAALVAILATAHPDKIPHFMAYLKTITHASRNFDGVAWASYDAAYRRQAAACSFYDWATIDSALYNEAFTGRARIMPRCRYCLSETHQSTDCAYAPSEETPHTHQPKIPRTTLPPSSFSRTPQDRPGSSGGVELCGLYNRTEGNQCNYKFCRYAHICSKCRTGPHPAADCGKQGTIRPPRSRPSYDKTLRQPPPATSQ